MKGRISICSILSLYFVISCRMGLSFAANVATGKTYNQSSSYSSISYPATDAADGNSRDCFRSSTGNAQEWWEVDLGRTYPVSLIRVVTDTGNYLYPFTITVDGKYCARLPDDNKTSVYVACSSVIYGQVVRITRTRYGQLRLCDFQVNVPGGAYYCEAGRWGASCRYSCSNKCGGGPGTNFCYRYTGGCYEENMAGGKIYRQSSTLSTLYPSRLASNGYTGDCYRSGAIYTNEWWEVDLGGKYPVSNIHITASYSYLYPFKITVDGQLCVNVTTAQQRSNPSVACSSVMYGQRVLITRTTRGRLQLCEVDINVPSGITKCPVGRHGEQCQLTCSNNCGEGPGTNFCYQNTGECYEVNVATGKTYSASNSYGYPSSYAADGKTNTCFRSYLYGNRQEWWEVDLGRKYPVHQFHITPYSSSYSSYLYPFTITVDGQMCVNETSFNSATFPTLSCPATIYGQVVRITSSPSRQLGLCEFEINVPSGVSRCEAGRWGPQCNHHCSNMCGGGPGNNFCFQGTGDCYDGCVEGWWGDRCQHRCNRDCEHHACQQGTGSCAGCRAGYHGDNCGDSCSTIASQCQQCTQGGSCTACSGNFHLPACTECSDGFYLKNPDAVHCTECAWRCDNNKPCNKTTGDCDKCSPGWEGLKCLQQVDSGASSGSEKLIGPVVGAVVGVGLLLAVVVVAAICWRSRSQMWVAKAETTTAMSSIAEPVAAHGNVYTVPPGAETSSAAAQEDSPYEIRDPPNPYERLRVYSNMTFEREAQSNVDLPAANKASDEKIYVNVPASAPAKRS